MTTETRLAPALTEDERRRLYEWGPDVFGTAEHGLVWRPASWHVLVAEAGELVAHAGFLSHRVEVAERPVAVGGLGGVVVLPEAQGKGYARVAVEAAVRAMTYAFAPEFSLLFCTERRVPLYEHLGWQLLEEPVLVEQPAGEQICPTRTMVLPLRDHPWPAGPVRLGSLPW